MPSAHPRPWHKDSIFAVGPRQPRSKDERHTFRHTLEVLCRRKQITAAFADIGVALVKRLGRDGQLDPSHKTLAADTGNCERTVRSALKRLRELGLISWVRRIVRDGWRVSQTSNAYVLIMKQPPNPPEKSAFSCDGKICRQTKSFDKSKDYLFVPPPSDANIASAKAALAQRRAVIEARLLRRGCVVTPAT